MDVVAVIPARYDSTRFEGKVLAKETGKYLVQHTYERVCCAKLPKKVIIATESDKVCQACKSFGAECVMTSALHQSGTDRIAEVVREMDVEIVVNVQADEPEIAPLDIDFLAWLLLKTPDASMATLVTEFENAEQIGDPNVVKVVADSEGRAVYFSRSVIPYDRERKGIGPVKNYLRHLGIYAYRKDFLLKITSLPQTMLEKSEKLEQLRAIEYGYTILAGKVKSNFAGIDTPEQYAAFVKRQGAQKI